MRFIKLQFYNWTFHIFDIPTIYVSDADQMHLIFPIVDHIFEWYNWCEF